MVDKMYSHVSSTTSDISSNFFPSSETDLTGLCVVERLIQRLVILEVERPPPNALFFTTRWPVNGGPEFKL